MRFFRTQCRFTKYHIPNRWKVIAFGMNISLGMITFLTIHISNFGEGLYDMMFVSMFA